MEIDYEKSRNPNLTGLQQFVSAYRSVIPYDVTGTNQAARLTIDVGDGDTYLTALANYATTNWLTTSNPVLDYANAMVSSQNTSISTSESLWKQHIDGLSGSVPRAGPGQAGRKRLGCGEHRDSKLQQLPDLRSGSGGQLCGDHRSRGSRDNFRNAWLHVLGWRMPGERHGVHLPTRYMRGRSGCSRHRAEHPDTHAGFAAELGRVLVRPVRSRGIAGRLLHP